MASAVDKQPAAARLAAVAAAGCLPTATNGRQNSYTTPGDTTVPGEGRTRLRALATTGPWLRWPAGRR